MKRRQFLIAAGAGAAAATIAKPAIAVDADHQMAIDGKLAEIAGHHLRGL